MQDVFIPQRPRGGSEGRLDGGEQAAMIRSVVLPILLVVVVFLMSPLLYDGLLSIGLGAP